VDLHLQRFARSVERISLKTGLFGNVEVELAQNATQYKKVPPWTKL
jgi:hypothetical protein